MWLYLVSMTLYWSKQNIHFCNVAIFLHSRDGRHDDDDGFRLQQQQRAVRRKHGDRERSPSPTWTRTHISTSFPQIIPRQMLIPTPFLKLKQTTARLIYEERNFRKKQLAKGFAVLAEEGHMGLCSNADPVLLMRFCYCIMDNQGSSYLRGLL